jgi:hypothetical protein
MCEGKDCIQPITVFRFLVFIKTASNFYFISIFSFIDSPKYKSDH